MEVTIQYNGQEKKLNLLIVTGEGSNLLDWNWLNQIKLNRSQLNHLQTSGSSTVSCQQIPDRHKMVLKKVLIL